MTDVAQKTHDLIDAGIPPAPDIRPELTDSIPKRYWSDLKRKLAKEGYSVLYDEIVQLKFAASDRKYYATDCANTEGIFRIIQSIPSPKAEPFKC